MTQHLRDLHQRNPDRDHLAGHGVAQPVRTHLSYPCSPARPTHGRGDRARRDRAERRPGMQEHLPPVAGRAPPPQVRGDRLTDIGGERGERAPRPPPPPAPPPRPPTPYLGAEG